MEKRSSDLTHMIDTCIANHGERSKELAQLILSLMSEGYDLLPYAGQIIKLLPLPQLPLKKVIATFLIRYSEKICDLNILATNSLLKDFQDPNPQSRRLAIKTACSIDCLKEVSEDLLPRALKDTNPFVRRAAVCMCYKAVRSNPALIDQLYSMIRDPDPLVVSNSLAVLNDILKAEGGIVINAKMMKYILSRINTFPEWGFVTTCTILRQYEPRDDDDVLDVLNALDQKFGDKNTIQFVAATQLAMDLIQRQCPNLEDDLIARISNQLISCLMDSTSEVLLTVLNVVEALMLKHNMLTKYYKHFFCRFCDPVYIKVKKLKLLTMLFSSENDDEIMDELASCCTDVSRDVSKQAIYSFMNVLHLYPDRCDKYIEMLVQLTYLNQSNLLEDIIRFFVHFQIALVGESKKLFFSALSKQCQNIDSIEAMEAMLWIISENGDSIDGAPYILETFYNKQEGNADEKLQITLIMAAVKLFFQCPAEMQLLLGQILQQGKNCSSILVQNQSLFYYNLLKNHDCTIKVLQM